jgi:cyclase
LDLVAAIGPVVGIPVIAGGGAGSIDHVAAALLEGADAVAVATLLHYQAETVETIKRGLRERGLEVRA